MLKEEMERHNFDLRDMVFDGTMNKKGDDSNDISRTKEVIVNEQKSYMTINKKGDLLSLVFDKIVVKGLNKVIQNIGNLVLKHELNIYI